MSEDRLRCWPTTDEAYIRYHDEEWGRPVSGEAALLERLCLEGFQSGLSWLAILRKRGRFRAVFASFEPEALARFGDAHVARLLEDPGIIRHRGKIEATIANARATVALHQQGRTLRAVLDAYVPEHQRPAAASFADLPSSTSESASCAKELKALGFRFLGPTTVYAAMQAVGVVNDHLAGCWVRDEVEAQRRRAQASWPG